MFMPSTVAAGLRVADRPSPAALLGRLCAGRALDAAQSELLFRALVAGELGETQIAALLIASR